MLVAPVLPPEQRVELCYSSDYLVTMARFTDAVEAWATANHTLDSTDTIDLDFIPWHRRRRGR